MILPFKPQFVEPILNGSKIHTIREDKNNRWKKFAPIQMATGVRTKNYNCFNNNHHVTAIQSIKIVCSIDPTIEPEIIIDGNFLFKAEKEQLAINDGFKNLTDMMAFFDFQPFTGKIIHWTEFTY